MDDERWRALSPLLDRALELTGDDRARWLVALAREEPTLVAEIGALLDEAEALEREDYLERSAAGDVPAASASLAGQAFGAYTLETPLGHGGMGSVWLAHRNDGRFEGKVAIKLLNAALVGRAAEGRFRREGTILARLAHPNITRLIDAGISPAGQPYLVVEVVAGERIDHYCDARRQTVDSRLRLFLDVLAAVAHAHANLIVHRDIKPSNVLVAHDATVKLLDFGIAKLLEDESGMADELTREAGRVMTPEFAAPEQLTGAPITTATDIYALGVLLYLLLSGQHPIGDTTRAPAAIVESIVEISPALVSDAATAATSSGSALPEVRRTVARDRSTTIERLRRVLCGDIDNIVAKALRKNPAERYASVAAFADDIRRYLASEPVSARPHSWGYRAAKFVRRNRTAVALASVALAAVGAGVAGTIFQAERATEQRDFALRALSRTAAVNDFNGFLLFDAAPSGKPFTVGDLLARAQEIVSHQAADGNGNRTDLLIAIGRQYQSMDEDGKARDVLSRAYDSSRQSNDRSTRARAACGLGASMARTAKRDRAEALLREGLADLPEAPQYTLDRIDCLRSASGAARMMGNAAAAVQRAEAAHALAGTLAIPSTVLEMRLWLDLAESYRVAGRFAEADPAFAAAFDRLRALGRENTQTAGTLLNNWGVLLGQIGQPLRAEALLHQAIEISRSDTSLGKVSPMLLVNYARTLAELGRIDAASEHADRAYVEARRAGDEIVVNMALFAQAIVDRERGDLASAGERLAEVEPRLVAMFSRDHQAFAGLAAQWQLLEQAQGNLTLAKIAADRSVALAEAAGADAYVRITFLTRRAELELAMQLVAEARADAARAVDLARQAAPSGTPSSIAGRAYLALGQALLAAHETSAARRAASAAADHLRPTLGLDDRQTQIAQSLASSSSGTPP